MGDLLAESLHELARPSEGLRAAGEASCLTGFVHGRRDRAIDCGGHTGGYNGHQRERVCRLSRQVSAGRRR
jgi:hypothetical protein